MENTVTSTRLGSVVVVVVVVVTTR
jgi:hypothetical protein